MKIGDIILGLLKGMFEKNMLTFNPGWNRNGEKLASFTDVRKIQKTLKTQGISPVSEADIDSSGPASLILTDPDGNTILIDQHV